MAILTSCCCWKSLRKGVYACAIYSLFYDLFLMATAWSHLVSAGAAYNNTTLDMSQESVLTPQNEPGSTESLALLCIYHAGLVLSITGIVTSLLLIIGVWKNVKFLLLPWIAVETMIILFDVIYIIITVYMKIWVASHSVAMILTTDFFINVLNIYALLCVISQYQEYLSGRGAFEDEISGTNYRNQYNNNATTAATCGRGEEMTFQRTQTFRESRRYPNGRLSPGRGQSINFNKPSIRISRIDKGRDEENLTSLQPVSECPESQDDVPLTEQENGGNNGSRNTKIRIEASPAERDIMPSKPSCSSGLVTDISESSMLTDDGMCNESSSSGSNQPNITPTTAPTSRAPTNICIIEDQRFSSSESSSSHREDRITDTSDV